MRMMLGGAVVCALVLVAGCGDQRAPAALDEPTTAAPTPTVSPAPSTPAHVLTRIPDEFPLLDGYPSDADAEPEEDNGRAGPDRTMEPVVPVACGARVELPEHTDWLRASWTNPEDYRQRQLLAFANARQAQAYADAVLDLYRACPVEVMSEADGESQLSSVDPGELGEFSGVVTSTYTYDEHPRPGTVVTHVVRVGTAVLVSLTYNEAGGGPHPAQEAAQERADAARQITGVADAMRMFAGAETFPSEPAFGPEGFGQVTVGMPREELVALPGVRLTGSGGECTAFEAPGVRGALEPGLGVAYLHSVADLETPEHVGGGSSYDEVRAAYPTAEGDEIFLAAEPPGFDDRYYRIDFGRDGRVTSLMLVLRRQHCAS